MVSDTRNSSGSSGREPLEPAAIYNVPPPGAKVGPPPEPVEAEEVSIGQVASQFLEHTSAHGLPRIIISKGYFRKILWALIFLGALAYFIYQVQNNFKTFFNYPVGVNIKIKRSSITNFPAVTVCNLNMLKASLLYESDLYSSLVYIDESAKDAADEGKTSFDRPPKDPFGPKETLEGSKQPPGPPQPPPGSLGNGPPNTPRRKRREIPEMASLQDPHESSTDVPPPAPPAEAKQSLSNISDGKVEDTEEPWRVKREAAGSGVSDDDNSGDHPYETDNTDDLDFQEGYGDLPSNMKDEFLRHYEDLGFGGITSEYDYYSFLIKSTTLDLSDLVDLLKPSVNELDEYSNPPEEFIVSCSFDKKNCSYRDFALRRNSYYGNCFTFNHNHQNATVRTTSKFGSKYGLYKNTSVHPEEGLRLTLNIHRDEYIGMFSHSVGAKVSIHPPTVEPFPEDDGIAVAPGLQTSIGTKMQEIIRQKDPYPSNCTDGQSMSLVVSGDYTVQACGVSCLQSKMHEECGCVDKILKNTSLPRCRLLNTTEEVCRQKVRFLYDNSLLGCSCPVACHELKYDTTVSAAEWPSKQFENLMKTELMERFKVDGVQTDFLNADNLAANLVRLHIYLENDEVLMIEEYPYYVLDQLVADIGGLLGLFIGLSICTAIEFLEFLFDLILICCATRRRVSP